MWIEDLGEMTCTGQAHESELSLLGFWELSGLTPRAGILSSPRSRGVHEGLASFAPLKVEESTKKAQIQKNLRERKKKIAGKQEY